MAIDFDAINRHALSRLPDLLRRWLPGGDMQGHEYVVKNPLRHDQKPGSFSININTGQWADFIPGGPSGGDPVSLYAYLKGLKNGQAASGLAAELGIDVADKPNGKWTKHEWHAIPVPVNVKLPDGGRWPDGTSFPLHSELGTPSSVVWFHNETREVVVGECRFDITNEDGKADKQYRPLTYRRRDDGTRYEWRWKGWLKPYPLFDLPALITDSSKPIIITEGARKAEAARELFPDYAATACLFGAKSPEHSNWTPLLGRDCIIWPDNDTAGADFANKVAALAVKAGAKSVSIVEIPDSWPRKWDLRDPLPEGVTDETLIEMMQSARLYTPETQYEHTTKPNLKPLKIGSDVEIAERVANNLKSEFGYVVFAEGDFYYFAETHWIKIEDHRLRCLVHLYDGVIVFAEGEVKQVIKLNKTRVSSVIHEMAAMLTQVDFFEKRAIGINCASGFIAFAANGTPTLQPHHPDHRCRHVLRGRWVPGTPSEPWKGSLLEKLLTGVFLGDADAAEKCKLIAETAGCAATGYATKLRRPKAVILVGKTAENGKSQLLEIMRGSLPKSAVSAISPSKLNDDRFIVHLINKLMNASDEASKFIASEEFKKVITGEPVSGRDVYRSAVEFRPIAQHVYSCNALPKFSDGMDRGVRRRLRVVQFNRVIPDNERVEEIGLRITEEEPDLLLAWIVGGASRVIEQREFTNPQSSETELQRWIKSDPVIAWAEVRVEIPESQEGMKPPAVKSGYAYNQFRSWALARGFHPNELPAVNGFVQRLCAHNPAIVHKHRNSGSWLIGLKIRDKDPVDDDKDEVEEQPESTTSNIYDFNLKNSFR